MNPSGDPGGPMRPVEFYILLALSRADTHGYGIIQETERQSAGAVRLDPGTLYRAIQRLRNARLLEESGARRSGDLANQRRKYYRLTDAGRRAAAEEAERLAALVQVAVDTDLIRRTETT